MAFQPLCGRARAKSSGQSNDCALASDLVRACNLQARALNALTHSGEIRDAHRPSSKSRPDDVRQGTLVRGWRSSLVQLLLYYKHFALSMSFVSCSLAAYMTGDARPELRARLARRPVSYQLCPCDGPLFQRKVRAAFGFFVFGFFAAFGDDKKGDHNMGTVINLQPSTFFCSEISLPVWFERLMDKICQSVIVALTRALRARRARPQSGVAAARAACVSTWLGECYRMITFCLGTPGFVVKLKTTRSEGNVERSRAAR